MKRVIAALAVLILLVAAGAAAGYRFLFPRLDLPAGETLAVAEVLGPWGDEPTGVIYLLSGKDGYGWTDRLMARWLAYKGAAVIGIDTPATFARAQAVDNDCVYFISDMEQLSQDLQRLIDVDSYHSPVIAGAGLGGTFALALAAQTPEATIGRTIAVDPGATLPLMKELCSESHHVKAADGSGWIYDMQTGPLPEPVDVLTTDDAPQDGIDHVEELKRKGFELKVASTDDGAGKALGMAVAHTLVDRTDWNDPLAGLPLTVLAASPKHDTMAIVLSGDGGWRDIDSQIGAFLSQAGVPTIGIDSLRYFWNERPPEDIAADLARIIEVYGAKWHVSKVALIGYSFGADALPAIYAKLPEATRPGVRLMSLLAYSGARQFEIQVSGILSGSADTTGPSTIPDLRTAPPAIVQCVYGTEDEESACLKLDMPGIELVARPGGHHFDDDYKPIAEAILKRLQ